MSFWRKRLLNTLMQIFIMLRHWVAKISRFKFDDYRVIRTGASDLKLFKVVMDAKYSGSESFDDNNQREKPPMGTTGHVYQRPDWNFLSTDRPLVK